MSAGKIRRKAIAVTDYLSDRLKLACGSKSAALISVAILNAGREVAKGNSPDSCQARFTCVPKACAFARSRPRSVLDAVEGFFSAITRRRSKRGVFKSVVDLEDAIKRYIDDHNRHAKPFAWTKTADEILEKLTCIPVYSE